MSQERQLGRHAFGVALVLALSLNGWFSAPAVAESCKSRFPLIRDLVERAPTESLTITPIQKSGELMRELAIERALWDDEVLRQRRHLETSSKNATAALLRLADLDDRIRGQLDALEETLTTGGALSIETAKQLVACREALNQPISARLAPARDEPLARRHPQRVSDRPEGYGAPPDEATWKLLQDQESKLLLPRPDVIAAKAAELDGNPVAIYGYVLDEIRPAHYFGATQGPAAVLRSGEGNDADQAALLAALMRAAGFPARVAWGVREIPAEALRLHFGAADLGALERTLTAAGIPWDPVLAGGRPRAYELERAWCEVFLPYSNFRGVVLDPTGSTWLALDPQLKSIAAPVPESIFDRMGLEAETFVDDYLAGDFCTPPLEDVMACPLPSEVLEEQIDAFLAGDGAYPSASAARELEVQDAELLPAALVGRIRGVQGFGLEYPQELEHRVTLTARDDQEILFSETFAVSELAGREAVVWFAPATPDDEDVVANYGGNLWRTPPYLVNVTPQILTEGESIAVGDGAIGMGRAFDLEVTLRTPGGDTLSFVNEALAGVPMALGIDFGAPGYELPFFEPTNTPEVLADLVTRYQSTADRFQKEAAVLGGVEPVYPFPSVAVVGSVVEPTGSLGLIERLEWKGIFVDADVFGPRAVGERSAERRWLELAQLEASAAERRVFEDLSIAAVSADMALILAADRGIAILDIDAGNLATVLPTLPYDAAILDEIEGWVLAGGEAEVPAQALDFIVWSGLGYRLLDPTTGEARYQLSGSLSGGMIAVPPLGVSDKTRVPLANPTSTPTNPNGAEAVAIQLFDGSLQIGTVGKELSDAGDGISLKVIVSDSRGVPVANADVEFSVRTGGGNFGGADTITVQSGLGGLAATSFTLGTKTDEDAYYLKGPDDDFNTRVGLNVVTAKVNGVQLNDVFLNFGAPDEVTQLLTPFGTQSLGLPHLSVGSPLLVEPADQYENPVSNHEVVYTLQGSIGSEPDKGPALVGRNEKCRGGPILPTDCGRGSAQITEIGGVAGTWLFLITGEENTHSVVASSEGAADVTFTATTLLALVPSGISVGNPLLFVARRGQPAGREGTSIEAYPPGETMAVPLEATLYVTKEDFSVVACGSGTHCTNPLGTYTTRRLDPNVPVEACSPDSCNGGTLTETARVTFDGAGQSTTISSADGKGIFRHAAQMPAAPGRYEIRVQPVVSVAVPDRPEDPDPANEVVACDDGCGATLKLKEFDNPDWFNEYVVWSVLGKVTTPTPVVALGHGNRHERETAFAYTIEPEDYPALSAAVFFLEDDKTALFAQSLGRGNGEAIVPLGEGFEKPTGKHEAQLVVNSGWVWRPGTDPDPDARQTLEVESEKESFNVLKLDVDIDSNNTNGLNPAERNDDEDRIEDFQDGTNGFGKIVLVNNNNDDWDQDRDVIVDFADGYNRDGMDASDDLTMDEQFVPLHMTLTGNDISNAQVRFTYELSDPLMITTRMPMAGMPEFVEFDPPMDGRWRIWTVPGDMMRNGQAIPTGNIVPTGMGNEVSAADLGFSASMTDVVLHLEAVRKSDSSEGDQIKIEVDPDGPGPEDFIAVDTVRATSIEVTLEDGTDPIQGGEVAWIDPDPDPEMPHLNVRILPSIPTPANVDWQLETTYDRQNGRAIDRVQIPDPGAGAPWRTLRSAGLWILSTDYIPETDPDEPGDVMFFGGEAKLRMRALDGANTVYQHELQFRIRGMSPGDAVVRAYIDANTMGCGMNTTTKDFAFAYGISRHESRRECSAEIYNQFEPVTCRIPGTTRDVYKGEPLKGPPDGWGLFQLDLSASGGSPPIHRLWNWQANVCGGIETLDDKHAITDPFLTRQRNQAMAAGGPNAPPAQMENNCDIQEFDDTRVGADCGAGTCTFDDAMVIKAFNGASRPGAACNNGEITGHYTAWDNRATMPPGHGPAFHWDISNQNVHCFNYVERVCGDITLMP